LSRERIGITQHARFQIVVAEVPFEAGLADVAAQNRDLGRSWLLVTLTGGHAGVGPLFSRDRAPCWHCLTRRMWLNGHLGANASEPANRNWIFSVAAREAAAWLRRGACRVQGARILHDGHAHPVIACCAQCIAAAEAVKLRPASLVSAYSGIVSHLEVD